MDAKQYLKDSARTANCDYDKVGSRMTHSEKMVDLQHAGMGLVTESAEFVDMLKKHLYYGKPLDEVNLKEEISDLLWYSALALRALGSDFESVMQTNIAKLKARYPDKFTEEKAITRDLETERKILEG